MGSNSKPSGKEAPVHVSIVLDRSGSMNGLENEVVLGLNRFLDEQRRLPGRVRVTLVQFDSDDPFEVLIDAVDLREVIDIDRSQYQPRGTTPLYDAVGRMIGKIDADIARAIEFKTEPEDQVVVIITDGLENASREHTRSSVFDMIKERRDQGWVFVFMGANQDVYAEGAQMAVAHANTAEWAASAAGQEQMWSRVSRSTARHRARGPAERQAAADRFLDEEPDEGTRSQERRK